MKNISLRKTLYKITLIFILVFMSSCLTINSQMRLNSNGSGTISIQYILERGLSGISTLGSDDDIVPLNLDEDYIIQMIGNRNDIVYENYSTEEDDFSYIVNVTFLFDNIDALNSILPEENAVSLIREGNETIFRQGIITETNEEINNESLEILNDIYKEHFFTLEVKVPSDIISVDQGSKVEPRMAIYKESFIDIITSNDKKEWSIRW